MERNVDKLSVESQIVSLIYRYALAADSRDVEAAVSCFAPDAEAIYFSGEMVMNGRDEIRAFFEHALGSGGIGNGAPSSHIMNPVVIFDKGQVRAETTAIAYLTHKPGIIITRGLHYSDICVESEHGWVFKRRFHRPDWQTEAPSITPGAILGDGGKSN